MAADEALTNRLAWPAARTRLSSVNNRPVFGEQMSIRLRSFTRSLSAKKLFWPVKFRRKTWIIPFDTVSYF